MRQSPQPKHTPRIVWRPTAGALSKGEPQRRGGCFCGQGSRSCSNYCMETSVSHNTRHWTNAFCDNESSLPCLFSRVNHIAMVSSLRFDRRGGFWGRWCNHWPAGPSPVRPCNKPRLRRVASGRALVDGSHGPRSRSASALGAALPPAATQGGHQTDTTTPQQVIVPGV